MRHGNRMAGRGRSNRGGRTNSAVVRVLSFMNGKVGNTLRRVLLKTFILPKIKLTCFYAKNDRRTQEASQ